MYFITLSLGVFSSAPENVFYYIIARNIQFRTVASIDNRRKQTILDELSGVTDVYTNRGFTNTNINFDHDFAFIRHDISLILLNVTAPDDHVGEVERAIRTIKERVRAALHGMPYRRIPNSMIR